MNVLPDAPIQQTLCPITCVAIVCVLDVASMQSFAAGLLGYMVSVDTFASQVIQ